MFGLGLRVEGLGFEDLGVEGGELGLSGVKGLGFEATLRPYTLSRMQRREKVVSISPLPRAPSPKP